MHIPTLLSMGTRRSWSAIDENSRGGLAASIDLQGCNPALIRSAEHTRSFVDAPCTLSEMKKYGRPPLEWENVEPIAPEPE